MILSIKSTDKSRTTTTQKQKELILEYMQGKQSIKSTDLLAVLGVKEERVKKLLQQLVAEGLIIPEGGNRYRTYRLS